MATTITVEGKTTQEAIDKGLKELNCRKDDVEIKVLEEEKKAFHSILDPRVVKIEMTLKEGAKPVENHEASTPKAPKKQATAEEIEKGKENVERFLKVFNKQIGDLTYEINEEDGKLLINIEGENASKLIGYRGEAINALQNLLFAIANKDNSGRVKIILNMGDYREKREETLKQLARKLERTVKRTGKKIVLEPMPAFDRKVIHTELQASDIVTTYSIGDEPHRKIVVELK